MSTEPATDPKPNSEPAAEPKVEEPKPADTEKRFTQADLDAAIDRRMAKERDKAEAERKKAEDAARAKALQEQGEYQKLSEDLKKQVAELEPRANERDKAFEVVQKLVDAEMQSVPAYVKPLLEKLSPTEQLEYITEHRASWTQSKGGIEPQPKPTGSDGNTLTPGQAFLKQRGIPVKPATG